MRDSYEHTCQIWRLCLGEGCAKWLQWSRRRRRRWWWKHWALVRGGVNVMKVLLCQQCMLPVVFKYHGFQCIKLFSYRFGVISCHWSLDMAAVFSHKIKYKWLRILYNVFLVMILQCNDELLLLLLLHTCGLTVWMILSNLTLRDHNTSLCPRYCSL
jgi:hypothetical protein